MASWRSLDRSGCVLTRWGEWDTEAGRMRMLREREGMGWGAEGRVPRSQTLGNTLILRPPSQQVSACSTLASTSP